MSILTKEMVGQGLQALDRIRRGEEPTAEMLADAPVLELWGVTRYGDDAEVVIRLVGVVHGHPSIQDGPCTTSPVLYLPESQEWVRTVSRYYRLGKPLHAAMAEGGRA